MLLIMLFVTIAASATASAQDTRDTVIVRQDGTAVRMQTKILDQFDASFDGGQTVSHFSDQEIDNLFKGWKIFRREAIGSAPNITYPLFGTLEIAYNDYYSLKSGKLVRDRKRIEYDGDDGYTITIIADTIIFLALFWTLRGMKKKEKTKAVGAFSLTSAIILTISMMLIYFINWIIISLSGVYEITAVGVFGSLASMASIAAILVIVNSAADAKIEAMEIIVTIAVSLIVNMGMGMVAGFKFGLFSQQAGAVWLFFGLYIGLGFIGWLIRVMVDSYRRFNEPINIDMANDPDLQKII